VVLRPRRAARKLLASRLLYVLLASLIIRLSFQTMVDFPGVRDSYHYCALIRNLARGNGYVDYYVWHDMIRYDSIPHPDAWMPPLYPVLAAGLALLGFSPFLAAKLVSVFSGTLLSAACYELGKRIGDEKTGLVSGFLAAFSIPLVFYSSVAMTDMLFCTLAVFSITLLWMLWSERSVTLRLCIVAGIVLGASYLCRPTAVLILLAAATLWLWTRGFRSLHLTRRLATVLVVFLLVISPWLARNYLLLGNPFASVPGYHLWTTHEGAYYDFDYQRVSPLALLSDPRTWRASFSYMSRIFLDLSYVVPVGVLAAIGMVFSWRRHLPARLAMVYMLMVFMLAGFNRSGGTWVRHVLPVVPLILVFSAYALEEIASRLGDEEEDSGRSSGEVRGIRFDTRGEVLLAVGAVVMIQTLLFAWAYSRGYVDTTEIGDVAYQRELDSMAQDVSKWLRTNADAGEVVMTRHPWHINYYSDRTTVSAVNGPPERLARVARQYNVTMLLVDSWNSWPMSYVGPYKDLLANRSVRGFRLIVFFGGPMHASLYSFDPEEYLEASRRRTESA